MENTNVVAEAVQAVAEGTTNGKNGLVGVIVTGAAALAVGIGGTIATSKIVKKVKAKKEEKMVEVPQQQPVAEATQAVPPQA